MVTAWSTEGKGTTLTREFFKQDFWMFGLAMLRYVPRYLRVKQVDGMEFFTDAKHDELHDRILRVAPESPRQWGTMSVAQMLHHLNLACGGSLGFYTLPDESYFLSGTLFRWILVDMVPGATYRLASPDRFQDSAQCAV